MSLFAKILAWSLLAMVLALVGFAFLTALTFAGAHRESPFSRSMNFILSEAERNYQTGGRPALADYLDRVERSYGGRAVFTDANGRDVLTGEFHAHLIERAREHSFLPFFGRGQVLIARESTDGRYWIILLIPGTRLGRWFLRPQFLWILGVVILLAYALARHLTSPMHKLQAAVERFGRGYLTARMRSTRADEFGQLARTFDNMADAIQKLREAEHRLLLDISHELRSPLARMGVALELAHSSEDQEAALARIQKEADRLNSMVSELLQITRVEGDLSALRLAPVRLQELLKELNEDCRIEAEGRQCALGFQNGQGIEVEGDRELLRRAIENVVRNAIRYAPPGTAVELSLGRQNGTAVIGVRDYGPGVPAESLGRIFDAFYRVEAHRTRSTGGVGLGLAIAKRAVELHGGTITAENAAPGLRVQIRLPISRPAAPVSSARLG